MKFVLIIVWFAVPQQQYPDSSNVASRQPLGVAVQEFDNWISCEAQAARLASPYIDANCAPKNSVPTLVPRHVGEIDEPELAP
jgi:hypothetical protein